MFPAQSNFRSGQGGSAWWRVTQDGLVRVWESQWDTIVRLLQLKAQQTLIPLPYYFHPRDCNFRSSDIVSFMRDTARARWQRTSLLRTDGVFDEATSDAVGFLLCEARMPDSAARLWTEREQGVISAETVRDVIWLAFFADRPAATAVVVSTTPPTAIEIPPDAILPHYGPGERSAQDDRLWSASFNAVDDRPPPAPSTRAPVPQAETGPSSLAVAAALGTAAALAVGLVVLARRK
jgi:hypothetical protein